MMTRNDRDFSKAELIAAKLLRRFGLSDPRQFVLEDLAMALGVLVVNASLQGAEARLVRQNTKKGVIRVSKDIPEEGRRRFAIGHELGHWEQHQHISQLSLCLSSEVVGYRGSREELEANAFSACLLMPRSFLRETYPAAPSLELVRAISEELVTTMTATAVRVVETTKDPCLVVFTDAESKRVQWWKRADRCPEVWLESCQSISDLSLTNEVLDGSQGFDGVEAVDPAAWFRHINGYERYTVYEESMRLGSYPTVITLLSIDDRSGTQGTAYS